MKRDLDEGIKKGTSLHIFIITFPNYTLKKSLHRDVYGSG